MLIQITEKCNENCSHCLVCSRPDGYDMAETTWLRAIRFAISNKVQVINVSGGDPFLHPKIKLFLHHLMAHLRNGARYPHVVVIESNGWWIEGKEWVDWITKFMNHNRDVRMQISTHKKFYPNYEWTMSHKSDFEKIPNCEFTHDWQGTDTHLKYMGRAKNIMDESEITGFPGCMNLVSYALESDKIFSSGGPKIDSVEKLLAFAMTRYKTCSPEIRWNGDIILGEGIDCKPLWNITDPKFSNAELFKRIRSFIPCNNCKCCKNLTDTHLIVFDEDRKSFKLDPVFCKFNQLK